MPKLVQCANCRKAFLGTSYTLMEHYQKCVTEKIANINPVKTERSSPPPPRYTQPVHTYPPQNSRNNQNV